MFILTVSRYSQLIEFEYNSLKEAAASAVSDVEFNMAYPVSIRDNEGNVLWEHDHNEGDAMRRLESIAEVSYQ